ncbi:uncharacterized protein LY89DRAFT_594970 [Mollisia scopiformis]|uniref:N-acetyltransferase domain-containing protein n=1 Tax=Mollisia scopiformis TaxID=149040 RepID=A0A194WTM1_MOLSC|nr:uncharacterized protein LY89DRAFT_594970 [Mollisia scopiformis]KUJ11029.1 hypothetical protein LY89DRAFT_594970 [Mollisia scopiformis]
MDSKFKLSEVKSREDFDEITRVIWDAFEHPLNPFLRIMFYLKSDGPEHRTIAKAACSQGLFEIHSGDASSRWVKINELGTGKMTACANWNLHETNPYELPEDPPIATWWPEGEGRNFATKFYTQCVSHKPTMYNKPHLYLNISATMPTFQRKGVGGMLVEWGLKWADEMGLESFTEATQVGKPLYEHYGFSVIDVITVDKTSMAIENPSEEWKELERRLLPNIQCVLVKHEDLEVAHN